VGPNKEATQTGSYTAAEREQHFVCALGNGIISNYIVEAEVGSIASSTIDWEGDNIAFYSGSSGLSNPAINKNTLCPKGGEVTINAAGTGSGVVPLLRPEDITVDFGTELLAEGGPILPGN